MTVQTETHTLPAWEERFFAEISLEGAKQTAKTAERAHETASASYIASLGQKDRDKQIVARVNFAHSLKRFHATQGNLKKAQAEAKRTHTIIFHQ
jgi:hypothetical protein